MICKYISQLTSKIFGAYEAELNMDNSKYNINKFIFVGLGNLKCGNVKNAVSANLFFIKFKYEGLFSVE